MRTQNTCTTVERRWSLLPSSILGQTRAQFILGETYVEELRLAAADDAPAGTIPGTGATVGADGSGEPVGYTNGTRMALDPRTMGIATTACDGYLSSGAAGDERACNGLVCLLA